MRIVLNNVKIQLSPEEWDRLVWNAKEILIYGRKGNVKTIQIAEEVSTSLLSTSGSLERKLSEDDWRNAEVTIPRAKTQDVLEELSKRVVEIEGTYEGFGVRLKSLDKALESYRETLGANSPDLGKLSSDLDELFKSHNKLAQQVYTGWDDAKKTNKNHIDTVDKRFLALNTQLKGWMDGIREFQTNAHKRIEELTKVRIK